MSETNELILHWKRPTTIEFPKVWHTFKARDLNSDELIEYRIEDVPESRTEEVIDHMKRNYILDEPVGQVFGGANDSVYLDDYSNAWRVMIKQKVPLICVRSDNNEIVGANMNFVMCKEDDFINQFLNQLKSKVTKNAFGVMFLLYENFDPYKHYGVNEFMASLGLSVDRKYRGRSIGDHFLATRKLLCKEFELKFTQTFFTSDFSNRNADKVGFVPNVIMKYEDVIEAHPRYAMLKNIKHKQLTLKTLMC